MKRAVTEASARKVGWLDLFVPASFAADPDAARRARLFTGTVTGVAVLSVVRGVSLILGGFFLHGVLVTGLVLAATGALWLLRRTGSLAIATHVIFLPLFLLGAAMAYQRGGVGAPVLLALGFIPGAVFLFAGKRGGVPYAAMHLLTILGFWWWRASGHVLPDLLAPSRRLVVEGVGAVSFGVLTFVVFFAYETLKGTALHESRAAERRSVKAEHLTRLIEIARAESLAAIAKGLAHEVNNPLAVIDQNLRFVLRAKGSLSAEASASLEDAMASVERIATVMREIHTFARSGPGTISTVDLRVLLRTATRILQPDIARCALTFDVPDSPAFAKGNEGEILQVIFNLLRDAMYACHAESAPEIRLALAPAPGGGWRLSITDNGATPPGDTTQEHADSSAPKRPRLGLAVAERIVSGFGGVVASEPHSPRGFMLSVTFPPA